jgi:hypothetical protein
MQHHFSDAELVLDPAEHSFDWPDALNYLASSVLPTPLSFNGDINLASRMDSILSLDRLPAMDLQLLYLSHFPESEDDLQKAFDSRHQKYYAV